jgi:hypothetical protein
VTVLAVFSGIRKNWFDMALRALHSFVHAAKRILRFVVIEFRDGADGAPSRGGMAIFTRYCERPMRAARTLLLRLRVRVRRHRRMREGENEPVENLNERVVCNHPVPSTSPLKGWSRNNPCYQFGVLTDCETTVRTAS